jgi:transposase
MVSRKAFPVELRERAVKMVLELRAESGGGRGAVAQVGRQLGINPETLRNWVSQTDVDSGTRPGTTSEVRELRRANEILKAASAYFARELDPRYPR